MIYITATVQRYRNTVIEWDVISYYSYLPGLFIYKDLTFSFLDKDIPEGVTIWTNMTDDNKRVVKMSCGLAILYAPFFLVAHGIALLQPDMYLPNGYSMIYSLFLVLSNICYTFIGFVFLRKILLRYFSDVVTALTLLSIYFSTNLLNYSLFELMSHSYLFCLITIFIYLTINWHEKTSIKNSIAIGLLLGLITLVRPIDCIILIVFIFYGISSKNELQNKIQFFLRSRLQLFVIAFSAFLILCIQMAYWKYATGHFLFWSYTNERFYWLNSHVFQGLFGFRKGCFIYNPVLFFATLGLILSYKYVRQFTIGAILLFVIFTYIIFAWWCWWYGGGLACRPMIDLYGILAIGFAVFLTYLFQLKNNLIKYSIGLLLIFCFVYGTMTNRQYYTRTLHYDSMTFASWKANFMTTEVRQEFWDGLEHPDYDKASYEGIDAIEKENK